MKIYEEAKKAALKEAESPDAEFARELLALADSEAKVQAQILEIVKDTFEPEAEGVNSAFLGLYNGRPALRVEYMMWARDSHTCVDFADTCVVPLEWFRAGYDYKAAYRKACAEECRTGLEAAKEKAKELESELAEKRELIEKLEKKLAGLEGGE